MVVAKESVQMPYSVPNADKAGDEGEKQSVNFFELDKSLISCDNMFFYCQHKYISL